VDTSRAVPAAADYVRGLLAHEDALGQWLEAHRPAVARHPGVYAAVDRIRATTIRHRESLVGHLAELSQLGELGEAPTAASHGADAPLAPPATTEPSALGDLHPVSDALTELQSLLRRAAVAYQRLWIAGSNLGSRPTFRLAAEHMRAYAAAAADLIPLLSEVMVWELREAGADCLCTCASCADLGVCLCGPASAILMERAVRETAPAEPGGAPVWFVRYGSPAARAGISNGDLITDAGGADVPDPWALLPKLTAFAGDRAPVTLRVERANGGAHDVTVTR
jgi:hypothetical protein